MKSKKVTPKISNPTASIIIPVYNVAQYVEKCVNSTIAQTYRNIEIIIVNDGSTDNSADVIAELARQDDRIIVINQKNAGVSSARNRGIDTARGEYILFVDGDDWLSKDCVEYMLNLANKTQSEMAISVNNFTTRDKQQIIEDKIDTWSASNTVAKFLYPGMPIGSWNKIYRHDFLIKNGLRFQENMFMGEGMRFITDAAQRADCVGVGYRKVYWYRLNNTSSATTAPSVKHGLAALDAIKSIEDNLILKDEQILRAVRFHSWMNSFYILRILLTDKTRVSLHQDIYRTCLHELRMNGVHRIVESDVSLFLKIKMLGILLFPRTMAKMINSHKMHNLSRDKMA